MATGQQNAFLCTIMVGNACKHVEVKADSIAELQALLGVQLKQVTLKGEVLWSK